MAYTCETPSRTNFSKAVEIIKSSCTCMLRQASHCDNSQWIPSIKNFLGCCWNQCNTIVFTSSHDVDLLTFSTFMGVQNSLTLHSARSGLYGWLFNTFQCTECSTSGTV